MPSELDTALAAGIKELGDLPSEVEEREDPVVPASSIPDKKETPEEKKENPEELSEQELENAKALFKALNNPKTSHAALTFLAKELDFSLPDKAPETKAEAKEQAKDIIEEMKEAAPGLEFLIDKIGPVIKKHLESQVESVRTEVETDRATRANEQLQDESTKALTTLGKEFAYPDDKIPDNVIKVMSGLMDKINPTADLKPLEYLTMIHDAARAKLKISGVSAPKKAPPTPGTRLASERVSPTRTVEPPIKMTLNQSIANAVKKLNGD